MKRKRKWQEEKGKENKQMENSILLFFQILDPDLPFLTSPNYLNKILITSVMLIEFSLSILLSTLLDVQDSILTTLEVGIVIPPTLQKRKLKPGGVK